MAVHREVEFNAPVIRRVTSGQEAAALAVASAAAGRHCVARWDDGPGPWTISLFLVDAAEPFARVRVSQDGAVDPIRGPRRGRDVP